MSDHSKHDHHALLQLLKLSVRLLGDPVDQADEPLLCCSPLTCSLSLQGIQPPPILLLLLYEVLKYGGELGGLGHLGLRNCWL